MIVNPNNRTACKNEKRQYLKAMGDNLKALRLSQSLSFRQMSYLCDIDYSDIAKIEKGKINITILTLLELAKALEVQPGEIVNVCDLMDE